MKKIINILIKNIIEHKWFILLFLIAAVIRFLYLQDNVIPFLFDHGKDSIAVLHMLVGPKIKLIGPWTSIPGLYFGPAWYYLLAPFYLISGFNPVSGAVAMSLLVLFQMYLLYKYFNLESAVIAGFSGFWIMISTSAWNPFPMTLLSIIILILLLKQLTLKKLNNKILFFLFMSAAFGFHFSSAFAIFYPIIIGLVLLLNKYIPRIKQLFFIALGGIIPFIPQLIFEVRNKFPQTTAIKKYFMTGESNGFGIEKIQEVLRVTFGEFRILFFESPEYLSKFAYYLFIGFIFYSLFYSIKNNKIDKRLQRLFIISSIFIILPIIGFFFLHFNVWYVYPMLPIVTVVIGTLLSKTPKIVRVAFISIFVLSALFRVNFYLTEQKPNFMTNANFYPVKESVIAYIREDADGRDFSVYTFKPDIYDFPYQYIFFTQGLKGETLPQEFAYEPGVPGYVHEKPDILNAIDKKYGQRWIGEPKKIYYIVTQNNGSELLANWWARQEYGEIVAEKKFGETLVVYTATPPVKEIQELQ